MNQFGIVCTPRSLPPKGEQASLGVSWTRSILYSLDEIPLLLDQVGPSGRLILTLNNENSTVGPTWSGWENALHTIASYGRRIAAVECGNELDGYWARNPADCPPEFGADLVRRANAILAPAGIDTLIASVVGPKWQDWLGQTVALCHDQANGAAFHPYGQRPDGFKAPGWGFGDLRVAITRAHELAKLPIWLTEIGVKLSDAGGEDGQADYARCMVQTVASLGADVVPAACYFAWRDDVGTASEQGANAFGLRRPDDSPRPAWMAYQQAVAAVAPAPTPQPEPIPDPAPEPALSARDAAWRDLWQSATAPPAPVPFNPSAAFYRYWQANRETAGLPVGPEHADDEGVFQAFSRAGVLKWSAGDEVTAA
jgi:hypothetical protein